MNQKDIVDILKIYKDENLDKYGIKTVGLFGSFARNEANEKSDIDICIEIKTPNIFTLVHIKEELQKLFSKKVDIVRVREKMNPYLKKRIEKEALYV